MTDINKNMNVQTWLDIRSVATLAMYYNSNEVFVDKTSILLRCVVEDFVQTLVDHSKVKRIESYEVALQFLKDLGFSLAQVQDRKTAFADRSRRAISRALQAESLADRTPHQSSQASQEFQISEEELRAIQAKPEVTASKERLLALLVKAEQTEQTEQSSVEQGSP